jgi:hypothetical protein
MWLEPLDDHPRCRVDRAVDFCDPPHNRTPKLSARRLEGEAEPFARGGSGAGRSPRPQEPLAGSRRTASIPITWSQGPWNRATTPSTLADRLRPQEGLPGLRHCPCSRHTTPETQGVGGPVPAVQAPGGFRPGDYRIVLGGTLLGGLPWPWPDPLWVSAGRLLGGLPWPDSLAELAGRLLGGPPWPWPGPVAVLAGRLLGGAPCPAPAGGLAVTWAQ